MNRSIPILAGIALLGAAAARAADPALPVGGDPRVDATDFVVTTFASGLDFPIGMTVLPDGSLLVGSNHRSSPNSSMLNSAGELVRWVDADDDGVADAPGSVLASGLDAITSVRRSGDLVFAATGAIGTPTIQIFRCGASPADPLVPQGSLDFTLPLPWDHLSFGLAVRERAGSPGIHDLVFNLGSRENATTTADLVPVSGLATASLEADALYRVVVDDTGPSLAVTFIDKVATGLRNAFGSAFDPSTGDLYVSENGMDSGPDAVNADELDRIAAADLGGPVEDFGFPDRYVEYGTGVVVGSGAIPPEIAFQPLASGAESRGAVDVAFAPPRFPPALRGGLFVAFHGVFGAVSTANTTNPLVFVDPDTGDWFHFVAPGVPGVGHLDGLAAGDHTLYVADLTAASGLETYGTGAIYAIRARLPACDDGRDNDGDGRVDLFGRDANGDGDLDDPGDAPPDPECAALTDGNERCGLGAELALGLAGLGARVRRRRGR